MSEQSKKKQTQNHRESLKSQSSLNSYVNLNNELQSQRGSYNLNRMSAQSNAINPVKRIHNEHGHDFISDKHITVDNMKKYEELSKQIVQLGEGNQDDLNLLSVSNEKPSQKKEGEIELTLNNLVVEEIKELSKEEDSIQLEII